MRESKPVVIGKKFDEQTAAALSATEPKRRYPDAFTQEELFARWWPDEVATVSEHGQRQRAKARITRFGSLMEKLEDITVDATGRPHRTPVYRFVEKGKR